MASITVHDDQGVILHEIADSVTIGRGAECDITVVNQTVSKMHCRVYLDNRGSCLVEDLGSSNGVFVRGKPVSQPERLKHGEEAQAGMLRIVYQEHDEGVQVQEGGHESQILQVLKPREAQTFLPESRIKDVAVLRADYEKLRLVHEIQRDLRLDEGLDATLHAILERTAELLNYDRGVILLRGEEGTFVPRAHRTAKPGQKVLISSTLLEQVKKEKSGILGSDVMADERFNVSQSMIDMGIRSTIAVPFVDNDEVLGVIVVDSSRGPLFFKEKDLELVTSVANLVTQLVRNSILHEETERLFDSSVRTFSAMVDARHRLTAGHSQRVAEYSLVIAKEIGLTDRDLEAVRFAALLHDVGKIGIPDRVLLKDGPFTDEERAEMNTHPAKTRTILDTFRFPGRLSDVPAIAADHHERQDGSGYPEGLSGEQLHLGARILAVADVFDALTAKRDYPKYAGGETLSRDPMPLSKVITVLEEGSGTHFDPELVEAFMRCLPGLLATCRDNGRFAPEYVDEAIAQLLKSRG